MAEYDYIIVGAGSAGSALAARLTEDGRATVLLLEAGGSDASPWVRMPIGYGKTYYDERFNWKYTTEPVPGLGGKPSYWPRGKILGGSSSINAMVWARGHPLDYEDWAAGAPGWGWADVAPVFRRIEDWSGPPSEHRGIGGPVSVTDITTEAHPLCAAYLDAAKTLNFQVNLDYNGTEMEGVGLYQITTRRGFRASAAQAYLRPALRRPNLHLRTRAHATRVLLDGARATGVAYRRRGRDETAAARREVILCGGAVNTPQLLQLSGIGPEEVLRNQGVDVVRASPHVGRNLQDHLGVDGLYRARVPTLNQVLGPWSGRLRVGASYLLRRRGPLSLSVNQGGGFVRLREEADRPELQLYFSPVSYTRAPPGKRPLMSPDPFPGFLLGICPCKPKSLGYLKIRSPDPFTPPEIQPNYLDAEEDRALTQEGVRLIRRLAAAPALAAVIESEIQPGPGVASEEEIAAFIRDHAWTVFHPCGTCRMDANPQKGVVDQRLQVHGIAGLRVADASIFPTIPTGNTNAPAIMVGEKAADLIRADAQGAGT